MANTSLSVQGLGREVECSVSGRRPCLGRLRLSAGQRSPETLHPLSPSAQAAWLPAVSLLCGPLSIQSPGEGRSGFPVRGLRIGVGVLGVERGEPSTLWERKRGDSGRGACWGWTWAQPRDWMCEVPKSQRPLPSC